MDRSTLGLRIITDRKWEPVRNYEDKGTRRNKLIQINACTTATHNDSNSNSSTCRSHVGSSERTSPMD